jgi:hypothetical protein
MDARSANNHPAHRSHPSQRHRILSTHQPGKAQESEHTRVRVASSRPGSLEKIRLGRKRRAARTMRMRMRNSSTTSKRMVVSSSGPREVLEGSLATPGALAMYLREAGHLHLLVITFPLLSCAQGLSDALVTFTMSCFSLATVNVHPVYCTPSMLCDRAQRGPGVWGLSPHGNKPFFCVQVVR